MAEPQAYQWMTAVLEACAQNLRMSAETTAATSAFLEALAERFPDLVPRYELLRQARLNTGPQIRSALAIADLCDQTIQRLRAAGQLGKL